MASIKELDSIIGEAIHYEDQVEELANLIGDTSHIHNDHEPTSDLEDAYTTALVWAEIRAEQIVNIIHPEEFANHDDFWHAVVNVRLYLQSTDVNDITIEDLNTVVTKGFQPCGL